MNKKVFCWTIIFFLCILRTSANICTYEDPVAAYDFTSDSSDCSGNGFNLQNNGATFSAAGAYFDGSDDMNYSNANWLNWGNNPMTMCLNVSGTFGGSTRVTVKHTDGGSAGFKLTYNTDGLATWAPGTWHNQPTLNNDQPYVMCWARNGTGASGMILYIDGVVNATSTGALTLTVAGQSLFVGSEGGSGYFTGHIKYLAFWNKTLTDAQILDVYNQNFGGGVGDTLNVSSIIFPNNNSVLTNNTFGVNLTGVNSTLPFNCSLYINSSLNQTNTYTSGVNNINFTVTIPYVDHAINYYISCYDNTTTENSSTNTAYLEVDQPIITATFNNDVFVVGNNSYTFNVFAYDVFLDHVTINDTGSYSYSNLTTNSIFNLSGIVNTSSYGFGTFIFNATACDNPNGTTEYHCVHTNTSFINYGVLFVNATDRISGALVNYSLYVDNVLVGTSTTGYLTVNNLSNETHVLSIVPVGHANMSVNFTPTYTWETYNFSLYTENTLNFTFKLERSDTIFPPDCTSGFSYNGSSDLCYNNTNSTHTIPAITSFITVEFISDLYSYNYTAYNGSLTATLLVPTIYTIRYNTTGYDKRQYYFRLINKTYNSLTLYMIPNTADTLTTTVYDESGLNTIEGAYVYLQRYFLSDNSFRTVDMYETDVNGNAYFYVDSGEEFYKFMVDYPFGNTVKLTNKMYIETTSITITLPSNELIGTEFFDIENIKGGIAYQTATNEFEAVWSDPSNIASRYCLYIKEYGYYGSNIINYSCTTTNAGSMSVGGLRENKTYYALFTATINNQEVLVKSGWKELVGTTLDSGRDGLLLTIILIIIMSLLVSVHVLGIIFGSLGLVFAKFLGLMPLLSWPDIIMVVLMGVIIGLLIQVFKR